MIGIGFERIGGSLGALGQEVEMGIWVSRVESRWGGFERRGCFVLVLEGVCFLGLKSLCSWEAQ